jgi:hypothetical protein
MKNYFLFAMIMSAICASIFLFGKGFPESVRIGAGVVFAVLWCTLPYVDGVIERKQKEKIKEHKGKYPWRPCQHEYQELKTFFDECDGNNDYMSCVLELRREIIEIEITIEEGDKEIMIEDSKKYRKVYRHIKELEKDIIFRKFVKNWDEVKILSVDGDDPSTYRWNN